MATCFLRYRRHLELFRHGANLWTYKIGPSHNIEVKFSDRDTRKPFGRSTVEFRPEHAGTFMKDIVGDNGRFRVRVKWSDGYPRLNRTKFKRSNTVAITSEIRNVEEAKRQKLLMEQPSTLCSIGSMSPATQIEYYLPVPVVEVFTVVIYGEGSEPFNFYGNILVSHDKFCIFSTHAKSSQLCPAIGTPLEINCHHSFDALDDFWMWINIKDINKSSISKGHVFWRALNIDVDEGKSTYEEHYYQSVIFHKDAKEDHPVQMCGFSIPLLKSVIAFPSSSSLTFQGDLMVSSVNDVADNKLPEEIVSLKGGIEFKLRRGDEYSGRIGGKDVYIMVTVECESMFI